MSVIRVGSSAKYADGWDLVFGRSKAARGKPRAAAKKARQAAGRKAKARAAAKPLAVKAARKTKNSARKRR